MHNYDKEQHFGSSKLNWFHPDAFSFIRDIRKLPPKRYPDCINLSIGAPNRPTPVEICDVMKHELDNPQYHTYAPQFGAPELCEAIAHWYRDRFKVRINAEKEVLITVGIKEAIFNALHALLNPGDVVLVPDPGYPTYFEAVTFCGGKMIPYQSDCDEATTLKVIAEAAEIHHPSFLFVNYPANPTGRIVSRGFYTSLSRLADEMGFTVLSDLAYSEIAFDGQRVPSFFEAKGTAAGAAEFFAFSKTYNMAGWRVGAIVADERIILPLKMYKSKIDSNVFYPIQLAAAHALLHTPEEFYASLVKIYQERRDILAEGFASLGLEAVRPEGAMYFWVKTPTGMDSWQYTRHLYDNCGILVVPGVGYGGNGKCHVRFGLVQENDIMFEAVRRLKKGEIFRG